MYLRKILVPTLFFVGLLCSCESEKRKENNDSTLDRVAVENGLRPPVQLIGEDSTLYNLEDRMTFYKVPGVSIAVVKDGKVAWTKGYGFANTDTGQKVDENTLFQAGSISKPVAALAVLKLVEEGLLDLDEDVNEYLKGWEISANEFTKEERVTARRLLSHTAGTTVWGFPGYNQEDIFPTDIEVLSGKGNSQRVTIEAVPGSRWRYSGGGYTILEKLVEDITGSQFQDYMRDEILVPLNMLKSTYEQPLTEARKVEASAAFNSEGIMLTGLWHNYPEQAAAGLWTTPTDLAQYCIEIQKSYTGKANNILSSKIVRQMLTENLNNWGLGPMLRKEGETYLFEHGGKNEGFTNNFTSYINEGNAVIIMTNGDNGAGLIEEIMRSISEYYAWDIKPVKKVQRIILSSPEIESFTGDYEFRDEAPGNRKFNVKISLVDEKLMISNGTASSVLTPIAGGKFIDLEEGDEFYFEKTAEGKMASFTLNGQMEFKKI